MRGRILTLLGTLVLLGLLHPVAPGWVLEAENGEPGGSNFIIVVGVENMTAGSGIVRGTGTPEDPWVIENLTIVPPRMSISGTIMGR